MSGTSVTPTATELIDPARKPKDAYFVVIVVRQYDRPAYRLASKHQRKQVWRLIMRSGLKKCEEQERWKILVLSCKIAYVIPQNFAAEFSYFHFQFQFQDFVS